MPRLQGMPLPGLSVWEIKRTRMGLPFQWEAARRSRVGEVLQQEVADYFVRIFGESAGICAFGCRGRCPHRPGRMHRFYGNLRRIRNFPAGRCRHRPLQSNRKMPTNSPKDFRFSPLPAARPLRRSAPAPLRKGSLGARSRAKSPGRLARALVAYWGDQSANSGVER